MASTHGFNILDLEPRLSEIAEGSKLNLVVEVQLMCPGASCGRTVIHNQWFLTDATLPSGVSRFTIFGFELKRIGDRNWLLQKDDSTVLPHPVHTAVPWSVVEACSGIGAVDVGYAACGMLTSCYVEQNPKFCEWLVSHGREHVVQGDITNGEVIKQVASTIQGKHVLSSGVSCQPFSKLGDMKAQEDNRSRSFPGALILGHYLQSMIIIMECTPYVKECDWAQKILQSFTDQTGFNVAQNVLHLHTVWPAHRTRWWAIVTHPSLGKFHIPDMPVLDFVPSILAVMPKMLPMPSSQCDELELDRYELRQFHAYRTGISSFVINKCKPLPTATHSWGSQAAPCMCGCRGSGFDIGRLMEKGLHGVLHSLDGFVKSGDDQFHTMRHLHPQEVSLLNGLPPEFVQPKAGIPLRLELAAVGQMGSPLQSCWVMGNLLFQMADQGILTFAIHPRKLLWDLCQAVLSSRDQVWQDQEKNRYQKIFERELSTIHQPLIRVNNQQEEDNLTQQLREIVPGIEAKLKQAQPLQPSAPQSTLGKGKGSNHPKSDNGHADQKAIGNQNSEETNREKTRVTMQPAFHSNGGLHGFETQETNKRKNDEEDDSATKRSKSDFHEITATLPWPEPPRDRLDEPIFSNDQVVWVGASQDAFVPVRFHQQHVGQLCAAEAHLTGQAMHEIRFVDSMGQPISQSKPLQGGATMMMQLANEWTIDKCPMHSECHPPQD